MPDSLREFSRIETWVHAFMRVPPYPEPPEGSPESIQVFRAGRNFYLWCMIVWLFTHVFFLAFLLALHFALSKASPRWPDWVQITFRTTEWIVALAFVVFTAFNYYVQRLNYTLRWYIITDRSLRIRTGILFMQELTMTFSNIQEIRVAAGPLQNLLKLADVEVQSAGGGSGPGNASGHVGRFQGVSNANAIRDLIVERLRQYRDSGLGESQHSLASNSPDQAVTAARLVLAEARALRAGLTSSAAG